MARSHPMSNKLTGLTFAQIGQRLCGLDGAQLPSVDRAQRMWRARLAAQIQRWVSRQISVRWKIAQGAWRRAEWKQWRGKILYPAGDERRSAARMLAAERISEALILLFASA
jgi:hypothetical protein